jgi:stringent starvation protein B
MQQMTSNKPYIIRALYEWVTDNKLTPYLAVNASIPKTHVPEQYVKNGQIVLNISYDAVSMLNIANDRIEFDATFNSVPFQIYVPIRAVQAIYAAENGQGMVFEEEEQEEAEDDTPPEPTPPPKGKPTLKIVK